MNDIFIITCYQFDITNDLVNLLGRDKCYLVVDSRGDEYKKFRDFYKDRILVSGSFGYYTIDEAIGRLRMIRELMKVTKGNFDWVHVISQNDLPTAGFFNRSNILEIGKEYVHVNKNGWMSNYFTVSPAFCDLLDMNYDKSLSNLINMVTDYPERTSKTFGAPSEHLWVNVANSITNRINDDLRMYTYCDPDCPDLDGNSIMGIPPTKIGHFTKKSSPITFDNTPELRELISNNGWYLFARKFDYKSDAYNWAYNRAFTKLQNL